MNPYLRILILLFIVFNTTRSSAQTPCENGMAGNYPCNGIDFMSRISAQDLLAEEEGGVWLNDIWGWTDPDTDKEYAVIGMSNGTSFVDVSDPLNPIFLGILNEHNFAGKQGGRILHDGAKSQWRDIKVYKNHAYIVSEDPDHGMQVFDLTQLRGVTTPQTFTETGIYQGIGKAHNLVMNEDTGFIYAVGANSQDKTCTEGGLHIIDVSTPDDPVYRACYDNDGYTHDAQCVIYNGPDEDYQGMEICFNANENSITLVNVNDKDNISMISKKGYSGVEYAHQGWLTEDHKYFLTNDELDELNLGTNTKTLIWDVQDLDNPQLIGTYEHDGTAIDHNLYIVGDLVYQSNYTSGLHVLDIVNISNGTLSEVAFFDSYVSSNATTFDGTWSNYPFFKSGNIIMSDITNGLFILRMQQGLITHQPEDVSACVDEHLDIPMAIAGTGFTYQWQIDDGTGFKDIDDFERYKNTTTSKMHAHTLQAEQDGLKFRCIVTDGDAQEYITNAMTLNVTSIPEPSFSHVIDGGMVSFTNTTENGDIFEWVFGDGSLESNEENPTHEYMNGDSYDVKLTVTNKCGTGESIQNINFVFTGTDTEKLFPNLSLYPNPAISQLNINLGEFTNEVIQVTLSNLSGKVFLEREIKNSKGRALLNIGQIPSGIYYVTLNSKNGKTTKKIVLN